MSKYKFILKPDKCEDVLSCVEVSACLSTEAHADGEVVYKLNDVDNSAHGDRYGALISVRAGGQIAVWVNENFGFTRRGWKVIGDVVKDLENPGQYKVRMKDE